LFLFLRELVVNRRIRALVGLIVILEFETPRVSDIKLIGLVKENLREKLKLFYFFSDD